jgi:hypothetical protein
MQKDYRISTDGFGGLADIDKLKHINITFYCVGEGEFEYAVRGKADIENEIAFVHAKRLTTRTKRIPGHKDEGVLKFVMLRKVPGNINMLEFIYICQTTKTVSTNTVILLH